MQPSNTMRKSKDEAEQAASEALKGAGIGAVKVCPHIFLFIDL